MNVWVKTYDWWLFCDHDIERSHIVNSFGCFFRHFFLFLNTIDLYLNYNYVSEHKKSDDNKNENYCWNSSYPKKYLHVLPELGPCKSKHSQSQNQNAHKQKDNHSYNTAVVFLHCLRHAVFIPPNIQFSHQGYFGSANVTKAVVPFKVVSLHCRLSDPLNETFFMNETQISLTWTNV